MRIPDELIARVDDYAERRGIRRAEAIRRLLELGLLALDDERKPAKRKK
jgi:metal-responsive CopG/Arc/MetJ family transcriptional regulator